MAYAEKTTVSVAKSKTDIEQILVKYGASQFAYATKDNQAMIAFNMRNRQIRFVLRIPTADSFKMTDGGKMRTTQQQKSAYEQVERQRWRALLLVIKAKLEAIESGISEFEEEFMANIVLPNGKTVSDTILPEVDQAYLTGNVPTLFLE